MGYSTQRIAENIDEAFNDGPRAGIEKLAQYLEDPSWIDDPNITKIFRKNFVHPFLPKLLFELRERDHTSLLKKVDSESCPFYITDSDDARKLSLYLASARHNSRSLDDTPAQSARFPYIVGEFATVQSGTQDHYPLGSLGQVTIARVSDAALRELGLTHASRIVPKLASFPADRSFTYTHLSYLAKKEHRDAISSAVAGARKHFGGHNYDLEITITTHNPGEGLGIGVVSRDTMNLAGNSLSCATALAAAAVLSGRHFNADEIAFSATCDDNGDLGPIGKAYEKWEICLRMAEARFRTPLKDLFIVPVDAGELPTGHSPALRLVDRKLNLPDLLTTACESSVLFQAFLDKVGVQYSGFTDIIGSKVDFETGPKTGVMVQLPFGNTPNETNKASDSSERDDHRNWLSKRRDRRFPIEELLYSGPPITFLTGHAGTGKSVGLIYLCYQAAKAGIPPLRASLQDIRKRYPSSLTRYETFELCLLECVLAETNLDEPSKAAVKTLLSQKIKAGEALIVLDEIDQLTEFEREFVFRTILGAVQASAHSNGPPRYVVAARPNAVPLSAHNASVVRQIETIGFDVRQRHTFLADYLTNQPGDLASFIRCLELLGTELALNPLFCRGFLFLHSLNPDQSFSFAKSKSAFIANLLTSLRGALPPQEPNNWEVIIEDIHWLSIWKDNHMITPTHFELPRRPLDTFDTRHKYIEDMCQRLLDKHILTIKYKDVGGKPRVGYAVSHRIFMEHFIGCALARAYYYQDTSYVQVVGSQDKVRSILRDLIREDRERNVISSFFWCLEQEAKDDAALELLSVLRSELVS